MTQTPSAQLWIKLNLPGSGQVGPGKIALLRMIREHESISGAARAMNMSYRRAWLLVAELNKLFARPLEVMNEVFDFLGVGPVDGGRFDAANANRKSELDADLRERLAGYYAPHNQRLYEVLGRELPWTAPASAAP